MVLLSKREELLAAWRALTGNSAADGWRTIPVARASPCRLLAGRHFPGNEEALLAGFTSIRVPPADQLPQGRGFLVSRVTLGGEAVDRIWVALCRQASGNLDLFVKMTDDVVVTLEGLRGIDDERIFHIFLARIKAWQDFMRREGNDVLGPEAEIGLLGELEFLHDLIRLGIHPAIAVEAWQGPLDGIQDFAIGMGAIEVKSTASSNNFPVTIGSLEQLDDSRIQPLFLAGIRFIPTPSGRTLPEQVEMLRNLMRDIPSALAAFGSRLLHAGFLDTAAEYYTRRFSRKEGKLFRVSANFPRLTRENVAIEITRACYEINLDLVSIDECGLEYALQQLRMTQ